MVMRHRELSKNQIKRGELGTKFWKLILKEKIDQKRRKKKNDFFIDNHEKSFLRVFFSFENKNGNDFILLQSKS